MAVLAVGESNLLDCVSGGVDGECGVASGQTRQLMLIGRVSWRHMGAV